MTHQEQAREAFLKAVKDADIDEDDWLEDCLPIIIGLPYACGYIARHTEELGNSLASNDEDYRDGILELAEYDIWK